MSSKWSRFVDHGAVLGRHELSDAEWEFVRPLLPESLRGRKRLDDRKVLNKIVWKFRTGVAWRDVPDRYGPWASLHTRFRRWALDGTFNRCFGRPRRKPMRSATLDGSSRSTRPSCALTSMRPGPEKGGSATQLSDGPEAG